MGPLSSIADANSTVEVCRAVAVGDSECPCGRAIRKGAEIGMIYINGHRTTHLCADCLKAGPAVVAEGLRFAAESLRSIAAGKEWIAERVERAHAWGTPAPSLPDPFRGIPQG
jgi:hypothetical protein